MASCTSETEPMRSASASSAATASSTSCSAIASGCSTARMASPIAAAIAEPETGEATQQRYRRQRHRVREADDGRATANTARGGSQGGACALAANLWVSGARGCRGWQGLAHWLRADTVCGFG